MKEQQVGRHYFVFNPYDNGGETLSLETKFIFNGDPPQNRKNYGIFTNQKITLNSYCNSSSFELFGTALTPENLRQLADELELARNKAVEKLTIIENEAQESVSYPQTNERERFEAFLKEASATVAQWPEWKRNLLGKSIGG